MSDPDVKVRLSDLLTRHAYNVYWSRIEPEVAAMVAECGDESVGLKTVGDCLRRFDSRVLKMLVEAAVASSGLYTPTIGKSSAVEVDRDE